MKKILFTFFAVLFAAAIFAQSPEKISYQAVVRNASNELVVNQPVGMRIQILKDSTTGTSVYVETQTPTTNANGLISIEIGTGTSIDSLSKIDWANGPYFIQTETDPSGGENYTISGVSQLISVPYALHAKTAESISGNAFQEIDGDATNEIQYLCVSETGDTLHITQGNWVIVPGISAANHKIDTIIGDLHDPILELQFDDDPYNHNMHIASDGSYYYTCNGGNVAYGKINKYTLNGTFVGTYPIALDMRGLMYNKTDGYFYASGFESNWDERNIYKITSIESGTFERLYTNLYDYNQASAGLSDDGEYIYTFYAGTLKIFKLSDGSLFNTLTGLSCGSGNYGGDGAVAVDNDYIYTWNSYTRTVYVYNHSGILQTTMTLSDGDNGHSLSYVDGDLFVSKDGDYSIGTWYGYNIRKAVLTSMGAKTKTTKTVSTKSAASAPKAIRATKDSSGR